MNYLSEVNAVFRHAFRLPKSTRIVAALNYSTKDTGATNPIKDDDIYNEDELGKQDVSELLVAEDVDAAEREKEIERKRNKSRLNRTHHNLLNNKPQPMEDLQTTVSLYQKRKQYALHGSASGVDPRLCFYTPAEMDDKNEYDRIKYPMTIKEMLAIIEQEKVEKAKAIRAREDKIEANLLKLGKWRTDLEARIVKKEAEAKVAKAKREQMLEDIRHEIGFKIDFKDPRFKALMEKKELEAKKSKKAEKKKKREEFLIAKVKEQAQAVLSGDGTQPKDDADDANEAKALKSNAKKTEKTPTTKKATKDDESSDSDSDSDDEKDAKKKE